MNAIQYNAFQDELEKIGFARLLNPSKLRNILRYPREATAALRASARGHGGYGSFLKRLTKGEEALDVLPRVRPQKRLVREYQADLGGINKKLRALVAKPKSFLRNLRIRGLKGRKEAKIRQFRIASPRTSLENWMDVLPGRASSPGAKMRGRFRGFRNVRPEGWWPRLVDAGLIGGPTYAMYRSLRDR
jgi:hypothetical protein